MQLEIKVWNKTVANLTLMALGSSAPEILMSAIDIVGRDFYSGKLGIRITALLTPNSHNNHNYNDHVNPDKLNSADNP